MRAPTLLARKNLKRTAPETSYSIAAGGEKGKAKRRDAANPRRPARRNEGGCR